MGSEPRRPQSQRRQRSRGFDETTDEEGFTEVVRRKGRRAKDAGLGILQVNITSKNSLWHVLESVDDNVHAVCLQEHKMFLSELKELELSLEKRGWRLFASEATLGERGGRSAGTAILVRR